MGHDGTSDPGEAAPGDLGRSTRFSRVSSHQCERVTRLGICDRNTGVGRAANRRRDARDDFIRNPLLVEKERLFSAAVEHERVSPLQSCDRFSLTHLLGEKQTDRSLFERLRRGRTDIDGLGVIPYLGQHPPMDEVVEDDHVRLGEDSMALDGDQFRIARTGANQIDPRLKHPLLPSFRS